MTYGCKFFQFKFYKNYISLICPTFLDLCDNKDLKKAHTVLVIGYEQSDTEFTVYTNDSNGANFDKIGKLIYQKSDGSWKYVAVYGDKEKPFDSTNSYFTFGYVADDVYNLWEHDLRYDENALLLTSDRVLTVADVKLNEVIGMSSTSSASEYDENGYAYWLEEDSNTISIAVTENSNMTLSDVN